MTLLTLWTAILAGVGVLFICVGTLGLLRLGDLPTRIHALTKADTLGLGLVVLALLPHAGSIGAAAKLLLVWALALVSASVIAHLLARNST
ncbi:cation:proton antiporter [Ornithinimicrobium sp. Y1694]|uniref:cation:proton antiporter n=1 Tax=Ornithinimicrobium sp. Y1694 TaxID=3418590 RepID=UPI003CEA3337